MGVTWVAIMPKKNQMVKWPFEKVEWLPKGWTGHFEKYIVVVSMSHHLFQKGTSWLHPRLFFFFGGGVLDFPRCTVFISSTGVNFHWLEARARWMGLNEFPLQICFWVLTPSSTKYISPCFFPLYIIHSIFSKKKNETRDFVLNHTFPRITVQVNKF